MYFPLSFCFFIAASEKLWPKIHPFESWLTSRREVPSMLCIYSSRVTPSPMPPALATQLVVQCQPLKVRFRAGNLGREVISMSSCMDVFCGYSWRYKEPVL